MNLYKEELIEEGFTEGNAKRLANALDVLHSAVSKMDRVQLKLLCKGESMAHRLSSFAKTEELYIFDIDHIR